MFKKKKKDNHNVKKKDKVKFVKALENIYETKKGYNHVNIKDISDLNSKDSKEESKHNFYVYNGFLKPEHVDLFESGMFIDSVKNIDTSKLFKGYKLRKLLNEKKIDKDYLMEQYSYFQALYSYYIAKYAFNLDKDKEIFVGPYMKYTNKQTIEIEKHFNASAQMVFSVQTHSYKPQEKKGGMGVAMKAMDAAAKKGLPSSLDDMKKKAMDAAAKKGLPSSLDDMKKKAMDAAAKQGLPSSLDDMKKKAMDAAAKQGLPSSLDDMKKKAMDAAAKQGLPSSLNDMKKKAMDAAAKQGLPSSLDDMKKKAMDAAAKQGLPSSLNDMKKKAMDAAAKQGLPILNSNIEKNESMTGTNTEIIPTQVEIAKNEEVSSQNVANVSPNNVKILNKTDTIEQQQNTSHSQSTNIQENHSGISELVQKHEEEIQELKSQQIKQLQNNENIKLYTIHSLNSFNNIMVSRDSILLILLFLSMNHNQRINVIQGNYQNNKPVNELLQEFYTIDKEETKSSKKQVPLDMLHFFGFEEKLDKETKNDIRKIIKEAKTKKSSLFKRLFGRKSKGGNKTKKRIEFSIKNKSKKDNLRIIKLKKRPKFTTKIHKNHNKNKLKTTRKNIK
jgi:hypothetical protein